MLSGMKSLYKKKQMDYKHYLKYREIRTRITKRRNDRTREVACNIKKPWTFDDVDCVVNSGLSYQELAYKLGRTIHSISKIKTYYLRGGYILDYEKHTLTRINAKCQNTDPRKRCMKKTADFDFQNCYTSKEEEEFYNKKITEYNRIKGYRQFLKIKSDPERYKEYCKESTKRHYKYSQERKTNKEKYEIWAEKQKKWGKAKYQKIRANPELKERYQKMNNESHRRRYAIMKQDPIKYQAYRQKHKEQYLRRKLRKLQNSFSNNNTI